MPDSETQIVSTTITTPDGSPIAVSEVVVGDKGAFGNGKTGSAFLGGGVDTGTVGGGPTGQPQ